MQKRPPMGAVGRCPAALRALIPGKGKVAGKDGAAAMWTGAAVDRLKELQDVYFMREVDHQTLEQLEKNVWPAPEFGSYLVTTCHQLRKKRLCDFTVEDLRIMIGQDIGIKFLIPKAIKVLKENPFAEGDFFEGDLLVQVVRVKQSFLKEDPSLYQDLIHICVTALASLDPVFSNRDHAHIERFLDQS